MWLFLMQFLTTEIVEVGPADFFRLMVKEEYIQIIGIFSMKDKFSRILVAIDG